MGILDEIEPEALQVYQVRRATAVKVSLEAKMKSGIIIH